MPQKIFEAGGFSLTSTWTQQYVPDNLELGYLEYVYRDTGPTTSYHTRTVKTSQLPAKAIINSVTLQNKEVYLKGNAISYGVSSGYSERRSIKNKTGGFESCSNEKMKNFLIEGQDAEGNFQDLVLRYSFTGSGAINSGFMGDRSFELTRVYSSVNVIVDYDEPIEYDLDSPDLNSFSLTDNWRKKELNKLETPVKGGGADLSENVFIAKEIEGYPIVIQNYSLLTFSGSGIANVHQPLPDLIYKLRITHETIAEKSSGEKFNYTQTIFSSENTTGLFNVEKTFFNEGIYNCFQSRIIQLSNDEGTLEDITLLPAETFFENIKNFNGESFDNNIYPYVKYNFTFSCVDTALKETAVEGSFYLVNNYASPTFTSPLVVTRVNYLLQDDGFYHLQEAQDGELVQASFSAQINPIPIEVFSEVVEQEVDGILQQKEKLFCSLSSLSYKKEWENTTSLETSESLGNEEYNNYIATEDSIFSITSVAKSIKFFNGEAIGHEGEELDYESFPYSPAFSAEYYSSDSYSFSVTVTDSFSEVKEIDTIEEAYGYLSIELGGVAIGERHPGRANEDSLNPTFLVALPSTFKEKIILVKGKNYGEVEPTEIFPDAEEGQIYFRLI